MHSSPLELYETLVESGTVRFDIKQKNLAQELGELALQLRDYKRGGFLKSMRNGFRVKVASKPVGIYIYGGVGRGKSMIMDLFFESAPVEKKQRIHFHAFMAKFHERVHEWQQKSHKNRDADPVIHVASQIAEEVCLLCLDEMQISDVADALILRRIFGELFERDVVVVFTSNRAPEDLYHGVFQRDRFLQFAGFIRDNFKVIELDAAEDYRYGRIMAMEQVYFPQTGAKAAKFAEDAFASLSSGSKPRPKTLEVNGRKLIIEKSGGDVAMFTFDDLCSQALGAADYRAIAEHYSTVIVTDIPIMTEKHSNQAKRFINMIDEFYEHKTKLICTAEAEPEKLYQATGGVIFEFARTVSRLNEMRSQQYLVG